MVARRRAETGEGASGFEFRDKKQSEKCLCAGTAVPERRNRGEVKDQAMCCVSIGAVDGCSRAGQNEDHDFPCVPFDERCNASNLFSVLGDK